MDSWFYVLIPVAVFFFFFWTLTHVKIAGEHERFAELLAGRFTGLKGPGFVLKWSGKEAQWLRIRLGDRGELLAPGIARIGGSELPVTLQGDIESFQYVRIAGFKRTRQGPEILVTRDPQQYREVTCEKCGHVMKFE